MAVLPVIFRKWKPSEGSEVIALFPTIPADVNSYYNVLSYQSSDEHGAASPSVMTSKTVSAKPSEYADLLKELYKRGYRNLKVVQKFTYAYQKEHEKVWRKLMRG